MAQTWEGVDLSHWNKISHMATIDYAGYGFLILKCGGNEYGKPVKDPTFESRYNEAMKLGFNVGAYYFVGSNFLGHNAGVKAAKEFIALLNGRPLQWGVWLDNESTANKMKALATEAALAFVEEMKKHYPYVGIYGSDISVFKDRYDISKLAGIPKWVARYGSEPKYVPKKDVAIWQMTSTGRVPGVQGSVDVDRAFINIKKESERNE